PEEVRTVLSFAAGAVFITHDINPPGPPFTGTWLMPDDDRFRAEVWTGISGGPGEPGPVLKVRLVGERAERRLSGTYVVTFFDPETGDEAGTITGTFSGERIQAA